MHSCQIESLSRRFPVLQEDYQRLQKTLKLKRLSHTLGVLETACQLSAKYGGDLLAISRAALYHDLFKGVQKLELLELGTSLGYEIFDNADALPEIAHGPVAALWLKNEGIISDVRTLDAIHYHTVGRKDMTAEDKIVYLADAIEPGRDYPGVDLVRNLASESLDAALLESVNQTLFFVLSSGRPIHRGSVEMRNALLYFQEMRSTHGIYP